MKDNILLMGLGFTFLAMVTAVVLGLVQREIDSCPNPVTSCKTLPGWTCDYTLSSGLNQTCHVELVRRCKTTCEGAQ